MKNPTRCVFSAAVVFLRSQVRKTGGKERTCWSVVENNRLHDGRVDKERAIRLKKLRRLLARLHELRRQLPCRDKLLMALGAAKKEAGRLYALWKITADKLAASAPLV